MLLKVLELYCGIGGMHYSLKESDLPYEVIAAVDINTVTNEIYAHNFPNISNLNRSIESMNAAELDRLGFNTVLMSPPCQPFTRVGLKKGLEDPRASSFVCLLKSLCKMRNPPAYILVENVKGFEESEAQTLLIDTLEQIGYIYQEFLISPTQLGVPNSRLRYYLIAKLKPREFHFETSSQIHYTLPKAAGCYTKYLPTPTADPGTNQDLLQPGYDSKSNRAEHDLEEHDRALLSAAQMPSPLNLRTSANTLEQFLLLTESSSDVEEYLVPDKFLRLYWVMDIVQPQANGSCCFTKRYGHHLDGAGSVLQMKAGPADINLKSYQNEEKTPEVLTAIKELKLRFFSPHEIAKLLCFPDTFKFPPQTTTRQCYRALGNSLNVHVVSVLIRLLVHGDDTQKKIPADKCAILQINEIH